MLDLYLVRHGEAHESPPPGQQGDSARALNDRGQRQAAAVGRGLQALGVRPDQIWHSPYLRATQTAQAIEASVGGALVKTDTLVPEAPPILVAQRLRSCRGVLVVVAHLPILPGITMALGLPRVGFATATTVHLTLSAPDDEQTAVAESLVTLSAHFPVEHWEKLPRA